MPRRRRQETRLADEGLEAEPQAAAVPLCALCERAILPTDRQSLHHLVPKLKGGRGGPTVLLHQMCHNEIHAHYTEAELAALFDTPEKLRQAEKLVPFIKWLQGKPDGFDARSLKSLRRRNGKQRR